jgi:NADH-quinone oxidoreductase subunit G
MANTVKIFIDDKEYEVPAGMNLVDAAKWHADNDIPVFCYHPKMEPVGMCRMCLVEQGSIEKDRTTGEVLLDENGSAKVRWLPKLQTACTQRVADGMVIRTNTQQVDQARENVLEFLLTSHPLDCPICDKGGECPLQNLTMEHGPGTSRMNYADKMHLDKHVPLGDLIYLDEERCIQCARCVRFQAEIVGDDVLAFHERGRRLQIITNSNPGFDTYFSGNTTDICPVGALTTADFRFGARPWELTEVPSIDPFDAAGSNISLSIRLDREFGGKAMIKRVMPRQNEYVNEIWISDKARFGHHFTRSENRLQSPMRRAGTDFTPISWNDAITEAANKLNAAGGDIAAIAGSQMSNEDLYLLRDLLSGFGSERLGAWPPTHAGADLLAEVGVGFGTNLGSLGKGDAVLVIASDLEEEVPIWRLRLKQARDRGAFLVVANPRTTRMDEFADVAARYGYGYAAHFMANLNTEHADLAQKLAGANNLIIVTGAEGLTLEGSRALMQAAANFLIESGHVGKANNGLLSTLPGANGMGLHYLGFTPENTLDIAQHPPKVLIVAQAELLSDDPTVVRWLDKVETIIALKLFRDEGATKFAHLLLPVQSFAERDGTFTNGERRVQRFYTAQGPVGEALPAWQVVGRISEKLGRGKAKLSAAAVMQDVVKTVPAFAGCSYKEISRVERQYPDVGGHDLYYGGTAYQNRGGLGVQIKTAADNGETVSAGAVNLPEVAKNPPGRVLVVPTTLLYNRESIFQPSTLMHPRVLIPYAEINSVDAGKMGVQNGDVVEISVPNVTRVRVKAYVNGGTPEGSILLPRHLTTTPVPMTIAHGDVRKVEG